MLGLVQTSQQLKRVIAQEIEIVFPEAVRIDKQGFKSVAYSILIAPLIEAVKEIYFEITDLKKENEQQKRQISSLVEKVEQIDQIKKENKLLKEYLCIKDPKAIFCKSK